jgi:hypothetical protein
VLNLPRDRSGLQPFVPAHNSNRRAWISQGVALGWYRTHLWCTDSVLRSRDELPRQIIRWAKGPPHTSLGQRPRTRRHTEPRGPTAVLLIGFEAGRWGDEAGLQPSTRAPLFSQGLALGWYGMHLWCWGRWALSYANLRRCRKELLHQPVFVGLEDFELVALGGDQFVERREAGGDPLLFGDIGKEQRNRREILVGQP